MLYLTLPVKQETASLHWLQTSKAEAHCTVGAL